MQWAFFLCHDQKQVSSPSRGGLRWGWVLKSRGTTHPHPGPLLEGEGGRLPVTDRQEIDLVVLLMRRSIKPQIGLRGHVRADKNYCSTVFTALPAFRKRLSFPLSCDTMSI